MVTDVHEPDPCWDCLACGEEWPCNEAKDALLYEHRENLGLLAIKMCRWLEDATPVLIEDGAHPDTLFDRFIGWTKPEPLDVAVASPDAGVPGPRS